MREYKSLEEEHAELDRLKAEAADLKANLAKVDAWKKRYEELQGSACCRSQGLIGTQQLVVRDLAFPIYSKNMGNYTSNINRVVAVTDKMIGLRLDLALDDRIIWYRRENGWRKGTKSGWDKIDVEKALAAWKEMQDKIAAKIK